MILGVIADDFTGATDVASMLVRGGVRTLQVIGVPQADVGDDVQAVVVALKSRTAPAADAVRESLAALHWLRARGARHVVFKVCSTFDSTPAGNIGPVAEALLAALTAQESAPPQAIVCPAFPENGRTVYRGHLFVGDTLLSDSGMQHHPLTPMTDANLVRVLQQQCRSARVGLLRQAEVAAGPDAVRSRLQALAAQGLQLVIADAIADDDLRTLAEVAVDGPLAVTGSGVALGLPAACARRGWLVPDAQAAALDAVHGPAAIVAGSCSTATQAQVAHWLQAGRPARQVDVMALARGEAVAADALAWARGHLAEGRAVLVYATADARAVADAQRTLGTAQAGALVERCLAQVAAGLVDDGVQRLVVAGGETSGAVVQALGVTSLRIGPAICPGVPWTQATGRPAAPLLLALKSGNFGGVDFFDAALAATAGAAPTA